MESLQHWNAEHVEKLEILEACKKDNEEKITQLEDWKREHLEQRKKDASHVLQVFL